MGEPKRKMTKKRRDNRRSHHGLKEVKLTKCKKCGSDKLPHTVCKNCSNYQA